MTDFQQIAARYIETWNETDADARLKAVADLYAEDGVYTDPLGVAEGPAAIAAMIGAVQGQFGGLAFSLGGDVDAHHDMARFTWNLGPAGAEPIVVGFDVLVVNADGRIAKVHGFLDKVPA
jgi:ketosteroid isomerase-like protein